MSQSNLVLNFEYGIICYRMFKNDGLDTGAIARSLSRETGSFVDECQVYNWVHWIREKVVKEPDSWVARRVRGEDGAMPAGLPQVAAGARNAGVVG